VHTLPDRLPPAPSGGRVAVEDFGVLPTFTVMAVHDALAVYDARAYFGRVRHVGLGLRSRPAWYTPRHGVAPRSVSMCCMLAMSICWLVFMFWARATTSGRRDSARTASIMCRPPR
jgi:hypothetical protein